MHTEPTGNATATQFQIMSKRKANNSGAHASKRRPNFTGPEMEVLFQGVESKRDILFSPVSAGYNSSKKKEAWEDITGDINTVSGEGRTAAEVKKKWADVKSEAKKRISKHRRDMLATGDGTADPGLSERDQRVEAIMEAKPVDGVPGAENMDTDQGYHLSSAAVAPSPILSPPLIKREIETDGKRISHNGYPIETCDIAVRQALYDPNPHTFITHYFIHR